MISEISLVLADEFTDKTPTVKTLMDKTSKEKTPKWDKT
jgi:hypothetical protein